MAELMTAPVRDRFLTVGWNNALTAILGLPALAVAVAALTTSTLSSGAEFAALAIIGAVY